MNLHYYFGMNTLLGVIVIKIYNLVIHKIHIGCAQTKNKNNKLTVTKCLCVSAWESLMNSSMKMMQVRRHAQDNKMHSKMAFFFFIQSHTN